MLYIFLCCICTHLFKLLGGAVSATCDQTVLYTSLDHLDILWELCLPAEGAGGDWGGHEGSWVNVLEAAIKLVRFELTELIYRKMNLS